MTTDEQVATLRDAADKMRDGAAACPIRAYLRFAASLRRRSRQMRSGRHAPSHALAMRLAGTHIVHLVSQLAIAIRAGEIAVAQLQAERARTERMRA